jgi:predicted nucleic acid-binding protein
MTEKSFVDTNIFLYANDTREPRKARKARRLLERLAREQRSTVSTQVINEFAANSIYKLKYSDAQAIAASRIFERFEFVALEQHHATLAIEIHARHRISFWDGLLFAAALSAGCSLLYTEDLNPGQTIAGVKVVDPFA